MAGSVKLNIVDILGIVQDSEVITADAFTEPLRVIGAVDGSIEVAYSGYDGTDGTIKMQQSHDGTNWIDWGSNRAQGTMDAASGVCLFQITHFAPNYVRAAVLLGGGTTATVTTKANIGYG
jgi:hypothetical protein